jgi:hypothetical protein
LTFWLYCFAQGCKSGKCNVALDSDEVNRLKRSYERGEDMEHG